MKIVLPLPENRANARWHWRKERRKKDRYFLECIAACNWRPAEPYDRLTVTATLFTWSRMDIDNLYARMKWPLDWLEMREIVIDDRYVTLICKQEIDRNNQRLEMLLEFPE